MKTFRFLIFFLTGIILFMISGNIQAQEVMWTRIEASDGRLLEDYQVLKKKKRVRHGKYRKYYKSGQLNIEGNYSKGVLNGAWKSLHYDGGLAVSGAYLGGEWIGTWSYYDLDSSLCVEGSFEKNKRVGKWIFIGEGGYQVKLDYRAGILNGEWELVNQDTLIASCSFMDGKVKAERFKIMLDESVIQKDTVYTVPEYPAIFFMLNYSNRNRPHFL